jgi:hypothetical protein
LWRLIILLKLVEFSVSSNGKCDGPTDIDWTAAKMMVMVPIILVMIDR